jgi:hypothetical protein
VRVFLHSCLYVCTCMGARFCFFCECVCVCA